MRIGVTPSARARLYKLFFSQHLDANITRMVTLRADEQVEALGSGQVDALYTDSPNLERALVEKDAVVLGDPARTGRSPSFGEARGRGAGGDPRCFAKKGAGAVVRRSSGRSGAPKHLLHTDPKAAGDRRS